MFGDYRMDRLRSSFRWAGLLCLAIGTTLAAQEKTEDQRRNEAVQRELKRLLDEERLEQRKRDFQTVVDRAERTIAAFGQLLVSTEAYATRMKDLLRNEDGRRIASDPVSLVAFVDLIDHPITTSDEVRARRDALSGTLELLKTQEEMVSEGHRPTEIVQDEVQQGYFWVSDAKRRFADQQAKLDTLIARAPPLKDTSSTIVLDDEIRNHRARVSLLSAQAQVDGAQVAQDSTRQILVDAAVLAELRRAQSEADRLTKEAQAQADRQKLEYETRIAELQKTIDTERARMRIEQQDRAAELARREQEAAANRFAADVDAKVKRDGTVGDAEKKLLMQKCQEPRVKQVLAPFLARGFYRPRGVGGTISFGGNYDSAEPVPISLSDLQQLGALSPTGTGAEALYKVATDRHDTTRPRWTQVWNWREDSRTSKLVPEAQKMLIELGPTLVELEMLQP